MAGAAGLSPSCLSYGQAPIGPARLAEILTCRAASLRAGIF